MSLLMQALKKAEHAKQSQHGLPADALEQNGRPAPVPELVPEAALSLSRQDAVESIAALAAGGGRRQFPVLDCTQLDLPQRVLSLQTEEKIRPPLRIEPLLRSPELTLDKPPAEPATPARPEHGAMEQAAPVPEIPLRTDFAAASCASPAMPKTGAEQRQAVAQEATKIAATQQKAQSVFTAKQPPQPQRKRRTLLLAGLGVALFTVLTGLGYGYWQAANPAALAVSLPAIAQPAHSLPALANQPQPALPASDAAVPQQDTVAVAALSPGPSPASEGRSGERTEPLRDFQVNQVKTAPMAVESTNAPLNQAPQSNHPPGSQAIHIRQSTSGNRINPSLGDAYQSFMAGDTAAAQQLYRKVLQQEPNNRDALLGMAAIAINQKQETQAAAYYVQLLELDPGDPEAIAGLTGLQPADPAQSESHLKKILAQQPQSGAVPFALGNLYARQERWAEAQQMYFRAYGSAPDNADYAFNLAVSLDRLSQPKLALDYYQRTLVLGQSGPGNFDRNAVQKRILQLQSAAKN